MVATSHDSDGDLGWRIGSYAGWARGDHEDQARNLSQESDSRGFHRRCYWGGAMVRSPVSSRVSGGAYSRRVIPSSFAAARACEQGKRAVPVRNFTLPCIAIHHKDT